MHMQYIQLLVTCNIYNFAGQGTFIGLILKQRIIERRNLVVKNVLIKYIKPHRFLVSNKMNLMPFARKCLSQLCCNYTATPISRITYYTYIHL